MVYKSCGKIVYDSETRSIKGIHVPVILDLVADQVRNRWYSLSIVLTVVMFVSYWIFGPIFRDPNAYSNVHSPVALISVLVAPSSELSYNENMLPFPVIQVVDATGRGLSDKTVRVDVEPHGHYSFDLPVGMNPYHPILSGNSTVKTNPQGVAVFMNLSFVAGVAMTYDLIFSCDGVQVIADTFVSASVMNLQIEYEKGLVTVPIGQIIPRSFRVCASDYSNLPVPNAIVTAYINPDSDFEIIIPQFGMLSGNVSITGEDGCTTFSSLAVLATTSNKISLSFVCQGIVGPPFEDLSIILTTDVSQIQLQDSSTIVTAEGFDVNPPPTVMVYDSNSKPLAGKTVFAFINFEATNPTIGYTSIYTYRKSLVNFVSSPSDATGMVSFPNLSFNKFGICGFYEINFVCDGVVSSSQVVQVTSSVNLVLCRDCINGIDLSMNNANDSRFGINVYDSYGVGLENKVVSLLLTYSDTNVSIALNVTNQDGFALWNPFVSVPRTPVNAFIYADGVLSQPFSISNLPSRPGCVFIEVITAPSDFYTLGDTQGIQPIVRAVDANGNGIPNITIKPTTGASKYDFPYLATDNINVASNWIIGSAQTDDQGYARFAAKNSIPFQFASGFTGAAPIVFVDSSNTCSSDYHIVLVSSPIISANFTPISANISMDTWNPYTNLPFQVTVTLSQSINLTALQVAIYITTYPEYILPITNSIFGGQTTPDNTYPSPLSEQSQLAPLVTMGNCQYVENLVATCTMGNAYPFSYFGEYTAIASVSGTVTSRYNFTIPFTVSKLTVVPPSASSLTIYLQQVFTIQPVVQVTDGAGNGVYGAIVQAFVCGAPQGVSLVSIANQVYNAPVSLPADKNGTATFSGLAFYTGAPKAYSLCFKVQDDVEAETVQWPINVVLSNFDATISVSSYPRIVVSGLAWSIDVVITTIVPVQKLRVELKVVDSPDSNYMMSFSPWNVTTNPNSTATITLDGINMASGSTVGQYQYVVSVSGFESTSFTTTLVDTPSFIKLGSNDTKTVGIMSVATIPVQVSAINGLPLSGVQITATIVSSPDNTTGILYDMFTTGVTDETGTAVMQISFAAGLSGSYSIVFSCGTLSTDPVTVILTNNVANVTILDKSQLATLEFDMSSPYVQVVVTDASNNPIPSVPISASFVGVTGSGVFLSGSPLTDSRGMASVYLTSSIFIPGDYQLQFTVNGVDAMPLTVSITNSLFPDFSNFDLHEAQWVTFLICLLTIPIFIGNSVRQAPWQLSFSVVPVILLMIIYVRFTSNNQNQFSITVIWLQEFTMIVFYFVPAMLLYVIYTAIMGYRLKKNISFYETKMRSCEYYVKQLLIKNGEIIDHTADETISQKMKWIFRTAWEGIKIFVCVLRVSREDIIKDAVFLPQRMIIGFGVSFCCLYLAALGSVLTFSWPIYLLGVAHDNLSAYLELAAQMKAYLEQQANGMSLEEYTDSIVQQLVALGISPFGSGFLLQVFQTDIPKLVYYMQVLDDLVVSMRQALHNSVNVSVGIIFFVVLFFKIIMFSKYKRRIMLLRRGRYNDVFIHPEDWGIPSAANYIGLSAVHTAFGYFIICTSTIILACVLQYKPLYAFLWDHISILITFLVGFPFISKMLTKFVVAKYIVAQKSIKHYRLWVVFDFMWIFVNLMSVMALTALRFFFGLYASVIILTRMDEPMLHSKYAHYDYGYGAYAGTLLMDHYHNNPILLVFVEHFVKDMKEHRKRRKDDFLRSIEEGEQKSLLAFSEENVASLAKLNQEHQNTIRRNKIITKWWLLYVLTKNPQLQEYRTRPIPTSTMIVN